jgi:hypothetical protein
VLADAGDIELVQLPGELRVKYTVRRHGPSQPSGIGNLPDGLDVVVFIRGVLPGRIVELIPVLQRQGIAVAVDVDDDYENLPSSLMSLYKINPTLNPGYNWRNVKQACRLADLVTVSTPALRRYGGRRGAVVLRNRIPDRYIRIGERAEPARDGLTVGWGGTVYGHPGDLLIPRAGVAEALREMNGHFVNVGDGVDVKKDLSLDRVPCATGIIPLEQYPRELATLDVAIAPLVLDQYRRAAKSWLKPLESLSLGSQVVASESIEYRELVGELESWCAANGCEVPAALVPSRGREWRRELVKALKRAGADVNDAARRFVAENHLMSDHAHKWGEAWEQAVKLRRKERVSVA